MPRFFVEQIRGDRVVLTDENAAHIGKSLRMRVGEVITLSDANGTDCEARIVRFGDGTVETEVLEERQNLSEPTVAVTLYQALPKVGKFEVVVQKAVELGVTRVVPMLTSRCVSRPDEKSKQKKIERYNKIALEAAKQSGRGIIPVVDSVMEYGQVLKELPRYRHSILVYEEGGERICDILPEDVNELAIVIGSEGGFSPEEVEQAKQAGAKIGTLGPRILRCETAPVAALAAIMFYSKNL